MELGRREPYYNIFLIDASSLFGKSESTSLAGIVFSRSWIVISQISKFLFLEEMDEAPDCTANVLEKWSQEVYNTPTFCEGHLLIAAGYTKCAVWNAHGRA